MKYLILVALNCVYTLWCQCLCRCWWMCGCWWWCTMFIRFREVCEHGRIISMWLCWRLSPAKWQMWSQEKGYVIKS